MLAKLAVLVAGVILGLYTAVSAVGGRAFWATHDVWLGTAALLGAGWALILSGLILTQTDHEKRPGVLLALGGFTWFLATWGNAGTASQVTFAIGLMTYAVTPAVVGHAVLSYRSGRARSWTALALISAGYLITVGLQGLLTVFVVDPGVQGCWGCPPNPLLVSWQPQLAAALNWIGLRAGLGWSAAMVLFVLWGLVAATPGRRRSIGLTRACALVFFVAVTARYALSLDAGYLGAGIYEAALLTVEALALVLLSAAVVVDLIRARLTHRALTRLVVELGVAGPGQLRDALAVRLGDPDLALAYPVRGGGGYLDANANVVALPDTDGKDITKLTYAGSEVALLVHRRGLLDSPGAVADLVSAVHLGLENERLHAEALAQLAELRSSGARIVAAGDDERRRLERDLHDGAQQRLVGLSLGLRLLEANAARDVYELELAQQELRRAIVDLRDIAHGIYPVVLKDRGLANAWKALAETRQLKLGRMPTGRFPDVVESTAYLLVARTTASGPANVSAATEAGALVVTVSTGAGLPDLGDVEDRVRTLDGALDMHQTDHQGTLITLRLPASVRPAN